MYTYHTYELELQVSGLGGGGEGGAHGHMHRAEEEEQVRGAVVLDQGEEGLQSSLGIALRRRNKGVNTLYLERILKFTLIWIRIQAFTHSYIQFQFGNNVNNIFSENFFLCKTYFHKNI